MGRTAHKINLENSSYEEILVTMKCAIKQESYIRLKAFEALYRGINPNSVKEIIGVSDKTFYSWVQRFNSQGLDGLISKKRIGRPRVI